MDYSDGRDETARSAGDHDDLDAILSHRPEVPTNFQVNKVSNQATLGFVIGDNIAPQTRFPTVEYRVYETPYSVFETPTEIADPARAQEAFKAGQLVGSVTSPGKGGNIVFYDAQYVGLGCWFFAVAVNSKGTESLPSPPVENPTHTVLGGGDGPGDGNDSDIPGDVTGAQVLLQPENVNGRKLVRVTVTANIPTPKGSFAGYQIYLQNYEQENEDVHAGQVVEGAWFVAQTNAVPGAPLVGVFRLQPDSPVPYSEGLVGVTNGSAIVNGLDSPLWDAGWTAPRRMCFYGTANAESTGAVHRYDNEIVSVTATPSAPTCALNTISMPWRTQTRIPYVMYRPDTQAIQFKPHPVRMYFVSISRGGTRRPDVLNSPYVEFPFGISLALSKPMNPASVTSLFMGSTIQLFWDSPSNPGAFDNTIDRYNIYRVRLGSYLGWTYQGRPLSVYGIVPKETIVSAGGKITWIDRQFNTDPTVPSTTPVTGWDFDPTDPGVYAYWVTATNTEGTENRTAYWGQMSVVSAAMTWIAGDRFSTDYEGETISNGVNARTVAGGSWVASAPNDLATTSAWPVNGTFPFFVGSATGAVVMLGNTGSEDDPTIYRDTFNNRVFNTRFYCVCAGNVNAPLTIDHGDPYGPAAMVGPQPTFKNYFSVFNLAGTDPVAESGSRYVSGTLGQDARGALPGNDSWSIWEYLRSNGGQVIPYFIAAGVNLDGTGEMELDPSGAASGDDYTVLWQHAKMRKFLRGEDLVISVYAKEGGASGVSGVGIFRMQMIRYDSTAYLGPTYVPAFPDGIERDATGGDVSASQIGSTYQRFYAYGKLPKANPAPSSVTLTNASSTILWTSGTEFRERWVGCTALLDDGVGNTQVVVIEQVLAGTGTAPDNCHTLIVSAAWAHPTHAGTISITIVFDRYAFKWGLLGKNDYKIRLIKPMVNGGRIGAAWTPNMRHDDEPGGDTQDDDAGNYDVDNPLDNRCVPAGTEVLMADGTYLEIEKVQIHDKVISRRAGKLVAGRVLKTHRGRVGSLVELWTGETASLACSPSHRVAVRKNGKVSYRKARSIQLGTVLAGETEGMETSVVVDGITERKVDGGVEVFTLTVSTSNYFAGGILCHNKPYVPIP